MLDQKQEPIVLSPQSSATLRALAYDMGGKVGLARLAAVLSPHGQPAVVAAEVVRLCGDDLALRILLTGCGVALDVARQETQ